MKRTAAILALLLCAAHAQARTLYVSLTGSHDTNAPAFSTWATAATNIQAAIDAADAGDTVRVAPGTYTAAVTINKNDLTVQGGRGTLWDADRTIIDRRGAASSVGVSFNGATNSAFIGFTVTGCTSYGIQSYTNGSNTIESCVIRGNAATKPVEAAGSVIKNCIVVGNTILYPADVNRAAVYNAIEVSSCIVEANDSNNSTPFSLRNISNVVNSVFVNSISAQDRGGNVTNATYTNSGTGSVCQLYNICPASKGVGSNLVWAGVSAYIPRLGSLARKNGQPYAGIETVSDGAGGPALVTSLPFLGRDATTNANHGAAIGGVTASTNSPFAGERSAAFDGASGYLDMGNPASLDMSARTNMTIEAWVWLDNATGFRSIYESGTDHTRTYLSLYVRDASPTEGFSAGFNWDGKWCYARFSDSTTAATGRWIHVSATRSGTNIWTTIDGAVVAHTIASQAQTPAYTSVRVGYNSALSPGYFSGNLSDLRIWSVARTPEQIAAAYTNRLTGTEEGLVGYWPLKDPAISPIDTGPFNLDNPIIHPTYMEAF